MLVPLIVLYFSTSGSSVANTYASLHWGHVLPAMCSLVYCFMLQAMIGIVNHGLTKTNTYTTISIIADMECWYVMVEYSLVVTSIFSFRTMGTLGLLHFDYILY